MKRFTFKRMVLSLVTSLMFLSSQSVWAEYVKLTALDGVNSWNSSSEYYDKLVDADISTKWGGWFDPSLSDEESYPANDENSYNHMYIIVKADKAVVPNYYFLVTGGDTGTHPDRNWASWKIYGGNFESDDQAVREGEGWTLIDQKDDEPLPAQNTKDVTLEFEKADGTTAYQYFWIEITKTVANADVYQQMSEWGLGTYKEFQDYLKWLEDQGTGTDVPVNYFSKGGAPEGFGGEGVGNLFDGKTDTKWCCSFTNRNEGETTNGGYVLIKASRPIAPTYYTLTTANDTGNNPGRNWKQWRIYGMNAYDEAAVTRESADWVLLDSKTGVPAGTGLNELPATSYAQAYFTLTDANATQFRYFKVEIDQIVSGTVMQMAELSFGDEYVIILQRNAIADAAEAEFDPDLVAEKALLDQMTALIAQVRACTDPIQLSTLNAAVDELQTKINASASNYAELITARNQAINAIDGGDLSEKAVAYLTTWISETDVVAPNSEYPVGNLAYIKANRQITGTEALAEANRINTYIINNSGIPDAIYATYEQINGSGGFGGEEDAMLYDGNAKGSTATKWCINGVSSSKPAWTVFKADTRIKPTYYGLVTGNDTYTYTGRNWKTWKIWGANFDEDPDPETVRNSDAWVLIDDKKNVGQDVLHIENEFESYIYLSEGCTVPYQYFKIEVYEAVSGDLIQMNEFTFYNTGNLVEYREEFTELFADYDPEERPAYKNFVDAYKSKYQELATTVNAPDVMKIKNELEALQKQIESSADLYEKYDSIYDEIAAISIESESLSAWQAGYKGENIAPCAKYIRGTYAYIMENCPLNNDSLQAEIDYLQWIYNAVDESNACSYILLGGHTVGQWGDGFYGHLIDGIALNTKEMQTDPETGEEKEVEVKATKWGGLADANGDTYIIFRTMDKTNPFFYTLTTGNDTGRFPERNWGTWYIYGANFDGDADATKDAEGWVLVDSKENIGQDRLHPVNAEPSYFGFSTETTEPYTYYKVVVTKAYEGNSIQMNEIHFGTPEEFGVIKDDYINQANGFDRDVIAEQALIDKYEKTIPEINDCMNMESLFRVNYILETLRDSITACAKVYSLFSDNVEAVKQYLEDNTLEESEALATLKSYIGEDAVDPNEVFVNGSAEYILDHHVLADSVVAEEIEFLESMKKAAVAAGYVPGTDISSLIVNRSFAKAEQVVDKEGKDVSGTKTAEGWDGYLFSNGTNEEGTMSAAEFCNVQSKFNISQTLNNLKNGYYEVKLNAGFRPNGDINSFNYSALAFANDTKTFVPVVREGMTDKDNAWLGSIADKEIYACDVEGETGVDEVDSVVVGYVIWGVQGTINAILQDRYEVTMVAKVTDGTLKFGIKNEGTIVGGDWLGAGNFRLTYLGEEATAEAIAAAAEYNGARVATMTEIYKPVMALEYEDINEYKAAPNFAAAQKEALADAASRTMVEQLVADGNVFEETNATKAAYYNLCAYKDIVYEKWINHFSIDGFGEEADEFDGVVYGISDSLDIGMYDNAAEAKKALNNLLAKYPDYLEIVEETAIRSIDSYTEVAPFNYEFATVEPDAEKTQKVYVRFGKMYDDLLENETILEFEYTSDMTLEGSRIYNSVSKEFVEMGTLESTSEFKKLSFNVKALGMTKASDVIELLIMSNSNGAIVNIRNMRFVESPAKDGDVNGDGEVNVMDAVAIYDIMAGNIEKTDVADVNGDGEVNVMDVVAIYDIMAGN
ncbi:MAG: hypothetical protein J6W52_05790 [Bacteroidaceae bacterium]|nr:hypothetical protein [Bacteroidaceae bacterium]